MKPEGRVHYFLLYNLYQAALYIYLKVWYSNRELSFFCSPSFEVCMLPHERSPSISYSVNDAAESYPWYPFFLLVLKLTPIRRILDYLS